VGYPEQAAQDLVQAGLEYLQRRRLHSPSGQPVPVLRHPQREEVLPHVQMELPLLQFVPVGPCPVAGHHWKELGPILLTPTLEIFLRSHRSLLFSRLNKPSSLSLSSQERCSCPLIILTALHWPLSSSSSSFLNWEAQNWTQHCRWGLTRAEQRRRRTSTCWPHSS